MSTAASYCAATGPRTTAGKAVSARNATTHGLFARNIVLPSLGEDPDGYRQVADELAAQLQPQNLLEQHYVEKIAAASWRLRRLHRWQAQLFEDRTLTEDARLDKLDKVLRHENHLHRQIDTAVKILGKDVPHLHESRARRQALLNTQCFEAECRANLESDLEVTVEARRLMQPLTAAPALDTVRLDAVPTAQDEADRIAEEKRQNEPPPWLVARQQAEQRERARLLETLDHDASEILPDGRPIYVSEDVWEDMQCRNEMGRPEEAAEYASWELERFLSDQAAARALRASESSLTLP